jgi:hypothetical protein
MTEVNEVQEPAISDKNTNATSLDTTKSQENQATETPEQINWKKFREERSRERKEKEELERDRSKKSEEISALKAAVEALANKPANSIQEPTEETEEQRISRQVENSLAARDKQYEAQRRAREHQEMPSKLASTFQDFEKVCSAENLDYLEFHYPEVATPFKSLPDSFEKWSNIYKAVKRFVPNPDSGRDQKKAEKNFSKPQSMSVPGTTITTDTPPMMLDDQRRADNWARMQKVMKGGR